MEKDEKQHLLKTITNEITTNTPNTLIHHFQFNRQKENQMLFFFKPTCFPRKPDDPVDTEAIIQMTLDKFEEFGVTISGAVLLDGKTLENLSIMDRHYGYINRLSKNAAKIVSETDREAIQTALELPDLDNNQILGGHEFLSEFPEYDEESLRQLWITKKSLKLRSGFYFQQYDVDDRSLILVNAFHPVQLKRFTNPLHKILVFLVDSDTDWKCLKNDLAGDTYPEKAIETSIRGEIYKKHEQYGLPEVNISNNGIHLSAGPFEALFEINNFFKNIEDTDYHLSKTNISRILNKQGASIEELRQSITNPIAQIDGTNTDLYSYTEEKNSTDAVVDYLKYFNPH